MHAEAGLNKPGNYQEGRLRLRLTAPAAGPVPARERVTQETNQG